MRGKCCYLTLIVVVVTLTAASWYVLEDDSVASVPVSWSSSNIPVVPLVIEGNHYFLLFNSNDSSDLTLNKNVLDAITDKQPADSSWMIAFDGTEQEFSRYVIPKALLGNLPLTKVIATQSDDVVNQRTSLWHDSKSRECSLKIVGIIGLGILQTTNWLLDFAHNTVIPCNSKSLLEKKGYDFNAMVKVSFECSRRGNFIILANSCVGPLKLQLSTGATVSIIQGNKVQGLDCPCNAYGLSEFCAKNLVLGGHDFGEQSFILFDIPSAFAEIDGLLGMDFLREHVIYIDYSDKTLYIQ